MKGEKLLFSFSHLLSSCLKTRSCNLPKPSKISFPSSCSINANAATCRAGLFKERKGISVALRDHKSINKILKNEESSFARSWKGPGPAKQLQELVANAEGKVVSESS